MLHIYSSKYKYYCNSSIVEYPSHVYMKGQESHFSLRAKSELIK